jgi:hypothetical protein
MMTAVWKVLTLSLVQAFARGLKVADRRKVEAVGPKQTYRSEMTHDGERCKIPASGCVAVSIAAHKDNGGAQSKVEDAVAVAAVSVEFLVPFCYQLLPHTHYFFARRFVGFSHRQRYVLHFCPQPIYLHRFPEEREGEQGIHQLDPQFLLHWMLPLIHFFCYLKTFDNVENLPAFLARDQVLQDLCL